MQVMQIFMHISFKKHSPGTQKVAVLLFDRFSNHCLANLVEPMRAVNTLTGQKSYDWQFVTLDGKKVESSSGLPILPDCALSRAEPGELLFVMPSYDQEKYATSICLSALRSAAERFKIVTGLDTGSWLMAAAGLLQGHPATIHWDAIEAFSETFPDVEVQRKKYVISGNRITCGGAMTTFDLVSKLIGDRFGEVMRLEVSAFFLMDGTAPGDGVSPIKSRSRLVNEAVSMMQKSIEEPMPIPSLAKKLNCSLRDLENRFQHELATSPRTVYRRLRLSAARRYVESSTYPIAEIALRCGYKDASAMTRAFRGEFGITPRDVRK